MPCVNPDGTLTVTAKELMKIVEKSADLDEISKQAQNPLFIVRMNLRELVKNGLIREEGNRYFITEKGKEKI